MVFGSLLMTGGEELRKMALDVVISMLSQAEELQKLYNISNTEIYSSRYIPSETFYKKGEKQVSNE